MGVIATLAIAAPVSAMGTKTKKKKGENAQRVEKKQLPANLRTFKTPFKSAKNKKVIRRAAKRFGPGKKALPRFKKSTSAKERAKTIAAIDRTMLAAKGDKKTPASIRDGIRVWEAMSPAQRGEVLSETDNIVAAWPVAVAATAAAVTAAVAVADFAYHVYEDQRDNNAGGDDDDEEETEDTGDTGDNGDTGVIRGALGY